jgi:ribosome-associated protein
MRQRSCCVNATGPESGLELAPGVVVPPSVVEFSFVSSGGPGGQNVNKRATKAELRVRLAALPLPADALQRLAALAGRRLSESGEVVIAADEFRSQGQNRAACLARLRDLIVRAQVRPKRRRATRPTQGSRERRLAGKKARSEVKRSRRAAGED